MTQLAAAQCQAGQQGEADVTAREACQVRVTQQCQPKHCLVLTRGAKGCGVCFCCMAD